MNCGYHGTVQSTFFLRCVTTLCAVPRQDCRSLNEKICVVFGAKSSEALFVTGDSNRTVPTTTTALLGFFYSLIIPFSSSPLEKNRDPATPPPPLPPFLDWVNCIPIKPLIHCLASPDAKLVITASKLITLLSYLSGELSRRCLEQGDALLAILNGLLLQSQGRQRQQPSMMLDDDTLLQQSLAETLCALATSHSLAFYNSSRFTFFIFEECMRFLHQSIQRVDVSEAEAIKCAEHILSVLEGGLRSSALIVTDSSVASLLSVITSALSLAEPPLPFCSRVMLFMGQYLSSAPSSNMFPSPDQLKIVVDLLHAYYKLCLTTLSSSPPSDHGQPCDDCSESKQFMMVLCFPLLQVGAFS